MKFAKDFRLFLLMCTSSLVMSCATPQSNPFMQTLSQNEYTEVVRSYSDSSRVYDGFYQVLEASATLINAKVAEAQLQQQARLLQWTPEVYEKNKSESDSTLSQKTEIFLSFFTPERKHDDLAKPKTTWKIFLDSGGKRVEGKAVKLKNILADLQALYPDHTRFSTAYKITFPVATSLIETQESKLTLTGPVGATTLTFQSLR